MFTISLRISLRSTGNGNRKGLMKRRLKRFVITETSLVCCFLAAPVGERPEYVRDLPKWYVGFNFLQLEYLIKVTIQFSLHLYFKDAWLVSGPTGAVYHGIIRMLVRWTRSYNIPLNITGKNLIFWQQQPSITYIYICIYKLFF